MSNPVGVDSDADPVEETYTPGQDRTLDTAILEAIAAFRGTDVTDLEFVLHDAVEPDAVGEFFRCGTAGDAFVQFATDSVRVQLWTGTDTEAVEIRVRARRDGWQ